MKYRGSFLEFTHQRNADLIRAFRLQLLNHKHSDVASISRCIADMPSARFWVSEERAAIVLARMLKGIPLPEDMRQPKREMFCELFRRLKKLMLTTPGMPMRKMAAILVTSPAPKFYMAPSSIRETIYKIRNGYYDRRRRR